MHSDFDLLGNNSFSFWKLVFNLDVLQVHSDVIQALAGPLQSGTFSWILFFFFFFDDFFSLFFSVLKVILARCWTSCTGVQFLYLYTHFLSFCLFFFLKVSLNFVFHPRGLGQSRGRVPVLTAYCPWPDNRREWQRSSWSWKLTSLKCSLQLSSWCVELDGQLPSLCCTPSCWLKEAPPESHL